MFFSMLYMIFYLDTIISTISKIRGTRGPAFTHIQPLMLYCIYTLMIGLAIYVSMTRISDYHHHATDVFSGSVIGTIIAVLHARFLLNPRYKDMVVVY